MVATRVVGRPGTSSACPPGRTTRASARSDGRMWRGHRGYLAIGPRATRSHRGHHGLDGGISRWQTTRRRLVRSRNFLSGSASERLSVEVSRSALWNQQPTLITARVQCLNIRTHCMCAVDQEMKGERHG